MAPTLFLTGTTGFVGPDVLHSISKAHPDWEWTCFVRNEEKGAKVAAAFPNMTRLLKRKLSSMQPPVTNMSPLQKLLLEDLFVDKQIALPVTYTLRGTLTLATESMTTRKFDERFDKVYDDWEHVQELNSLPDHAPHRHVDRIILEAGSDKIKTAVIAPAVIYGTSRGPDKTRSYPFLESFLKIQKGLVVGKGDNTWHTVHVQDLSNIYRLLAEDAVAGGPAAAWNDEGYYLAENGSGSPVKCCNWLHRFPQERPHSIG